MTQNDGVGGYSLTEVLEAQSPDVRFLAEKLVPSEGLTILAGESGIGKSHLMLSIVSAMASGNPALGCLYTEGSRIQVFTEDDITVLQPYMRRISANYPGINGANINFQPEVYKHDVFLEKMEAFMPEVVFVDPIMMIANIKNENDNSQVKEYLYELKSWIKDRGISLVLTRHLRKKDMKMDDDADSIFSRVLGAQAWISVPYHRLIMWRDKNGEFRLTCYSKYTEPFDWGVRFDKTKGLLTIDPDHGSVRTKPPSEYRRPIIEVLEKVNGAYLKTNDIRSIIIQWKLMDESKVNPDALRKELARMSEEDSILMREKRDNAWHYAMPTGVGDLMGMSKYASPIETSDDSEDDDECILHEEV